MFFLARCAFWLSVVFYSMTWPQNFFQSTDMQSDALKIASDTAGGLASAAGTAVVAKLQETCSKAPAECLAVAARLPQIVAMNQASATQMPKWPLRLAESDASWPPAPHRSALMHN